MAAPEPLMPLRRGAIGHWADTLRQAAAAGGARGLVLRLLEPLHVLSLRHGFGGHVAIARALQPLGLASPTAAGQLAGAPGLAGPWVWWRSPSEWTLAALTPQPLQEVQQGLRDIGPGPLACAIDLSDGTWGVELQGRGIDALMSRLVDAASLPRGAGQATRARLVDVPVTLVRHDEARLWLLADRSLDHYLADWLAYALSASDGGG